MKINALLPLRIRGQQLHSSHCEPPSQSSQRRGSLKSQIRGLPQAVGSVDDHWYETVVGRCRPIAHGWLLAVNSPRAAAPCFHEHDRHDLPKSQTALGPIRLGSPPSWKPNNAPFSSTPPSLSPSLTTPPFSFPLVVVLPPSSFP